MSTIFYGIPGKFPSPCGEKVGINRELAGNGPTWVGPFPSPCGEKVGINSYTGGGVEFVDGEFPSPCGEKVGINLLECV